MALYSRESDHATSFLALPIHLRHRILVEAGVPQRHRFYLGFTSSNSSTRLDSYGDASPEYLTTLNDARSEENPYYPILASLLRVCRALKNDTIVLLYSGNGFWSRSFEGVSLRRLFSLSSLAMRSLTELELHLNIATYGGSKFCPPPTQIDDNQAQPPTDPLSLSDSSFNQFLETWQTFVERLADHVQPHQLWLNMICDTADVATATLVVKPLDALPMLRACTIRLSGHPDADIYGVAHRTAVAKTTGTYPTGVFPFISLPHEIRRSIFEYTDLVLPFREVFWNKRCRFHTIWPRDPYGGLDDRVYQKVRDYTDCRKYGAPGCYCRRHHAAHSTSTLQISGLSQEEKLTKNGQYHRPCRCWLPPTALFLVSRAVLADAREVFFRRNRFIINFPEFPRNVAYSNTTLEASTFVSKAFSGAALSQVRHLEFVLPSHEDTPKDYILDTLRDLGNALAAAKTSFCLPKLTIRVFLPFVKPLPDEESIPAVREKHSIRAMAPRVSAAVLEGALLALQYCKGSQKLFVHFMQRWYRGDAAWTWEAYPSERQEWDAERLRIQAELLEREALGTDYHSSKLRKDSEPYCTWMLLSSLSSPIVWYGNSSEEPLSRHYI